MAVIVLGSVHCDSEKSSTQSWDILMDRGVCASKVHFCLAVLVTAENNRHKKWTGFVLPSIEIDGGPMEGYRVAMIIAMK